MRWKILPEPDLLDRRVQRAFLWRRLRINTEVRWLERAVWVEERRFTSEGVCWVPIRWADV